MTRALGCVRNAVRRARALGYDVVIRDLGDWGARVRPCAELDRSAREIVLDRRLLTAARRRFGRAGAAALAAAALAHELAHLADRGASEAAIRAGVDRGVGFDADARVRSAFA